MTEQGPATSSADVTPELIAISWQLGDDVRLIRRTVAAKDEQIGRVLERVLMEAFVLGHLREVDAFLDPGSVRNRWQAFVRKHGQDDPIQMNQTFVEAKLSQNDRLLLRTLPQPIVPVESLTEDLLQQPQKTGGVVWIFLTLFAFVLAGGIALWFLRSTIWGPSVGKQPAQRRVQAPLPALPRPSLPPAPEKRAVQEAPPTESVPEAVTEPHKEAPPEVDEPVQMDASNGDEEDPPAPRPRKIRRVRTLPPTLKGKKRRKRLRRRKQPETRTKLIRKSKRRRSKKKALETKAGTKKLRKKGTKKLRKKRKRLPKARRAVTPREP